MLATGIAIGWDTETNASTDPLEMEIHVEQYNRTLYLTQ